MKKIALSVLLLSLLFTAACMYGGMPPFSDSYRLGRVWYERESDWSGVWTRRGNSDVFDAVWTNGGRRVTAVLRIRMSGDHVSIVRRHGSDGLDVEYSGTLSYDGTRVNGEYYQRDGVAATWEATITDYR